MIEVDIIVSEEVSEIFPFDTGHLKKHAVFVLESSGISECDVNIVFIDDMNMNMLNEKYRVRTDSTDVLSFTLSDEDADRTEGEVYVSLEKAREQALECEVPFAEEVVRLVTHGLLHLAGRVHDTEAGYGAMVSDTEKYVENCFTDGEKL